MNNIHHKEITIRQYKGSIVEAFSELKRLEDALYMEEIDQATFDRAAEPFIKRIHDRAEKVSRELSLHREKPQP